MSTSSISCACGRARTVSSGDPHLPIRTCTRVLRRATQTRSFYSPFAVLSDAHSPLTSAPAPTSSVSSDVSDAHTAAYEHEHASRTVYVVSEPDPSDAPYAVPAGAYPTSAPRPSEFNEPMPRPTPTLTRRVPTNSAGVGDSAAVRYAEAPGVMGARGGSRGGLGLMDAATTVAPADSELADRSPPPILDTAVEYGKKGNDKAWKARK
ncbi:hypothetical protein EVG20_g7075 [Dentipellis fragilis]|uniref:Uncharacterized protein n=1 Tax=Dentipellis fragilis TaxID=205917 RepID=A0A4Y9YFS6_9AGAM|nr:hypothetical protein EVG20_g7075 [Dentipellis fragilis]